MNEKMSKIYPAVLRESKGFTLVELLVAVVVSVIVVTATIKVYKHMQNSSVQQVEISMLQQNQRGALAILERELRLIGMDRGQVKLFGLTDVRRFTISEPLTDAIPDASATGSPILRMTLDLDEDGSIGANETITYSLYDRDNDGLPPYDLSRSTTLPGADVISGRELLAEGIEAIGFAYAFDADNDGRIDRTVVNPGDPPSIIWAIDSNNDNLLDADPGGTPLGYTVPVSAIRGVEFWVLGCAQRPDPTYVNSSQYSVGYKTITPPANDHFHRWLLNEIIHCRNL